MKTRLLLVAATLFLALSYRLVSARDCSGQGDPCGNRTEWNEFESFRLHVKYEGMSVPATWHIQSSRTSGDLQVDIDYRDPKSPQHGTIMIVEGTTMISRGIRLSAGREIDALDGPVLSAILVAKILSRALPNGPADLSGKQQVLHEDKQLGIQFATPSAQGFIPPPWSVKGFVVPNPDRSIDIDLSLKYRTGDATRTNREAIITFSGQLRHVTNFQIDSNMSLEGWSVFGVGPIVEKTERGTRFDYGAKPATTKPATVADIRKALAIENSPGEPDLSVNFSGFWKTKCSDTYGLRIKPVQKPGMYTVTFCGPGGCGDEEKERKTFIKGDKRYNIVSATELEVGSGADRSTYRKCSEKMLP